MFLYFFKEAIIVETPTTTTLTATVLCVQPCCLLVCDCCSSQEILVHTNHACCFCAGDCVCIEYSGAMTMSIPPQISAAHIARHSPCCH